MTDSLSTEPNQHPESQDERGIGWGWKHTIAILFSLGITVLIIVFRDELRELEKLAYIGVFLAMLIGNSTVILPVPGLIVVYVLGGTLNPLLVGLVAGPGAALGEMTGYLTGYSSSVVVGNLKLYHQIKKWMKRYGAIVITLLAAFPNPIFDLAGLVAGSIHMKWWHFLIAAWIGKTIQGILTAYAGELSLVWFEQFLTH